MDWGLLIGVLSPSLIVILAGLIWQQFPPKKINHLYGYRTQRSMKNQQTWDYANRIGPVMFIKTGSYLLLIGVLAYWLSEPTGAIWISGVTMVVGLIAGVIACERKLEKRFDAEGNPKG
ncbi:SdpI family protein [Flavobacteriaceae bacterium D16]|nr:SdpI family protein [Flavobacteriaceae bacterium D16]